MTLVEPQPGAEGALGNLGAFVASMPRPARERFMLTRTEPELRVVQRALALRNDPLGTAAYADLEYEPICIPRVKAALAARGPEGERYPTSFAAAAAGVPLPEPCGDCPAERFDAALEFDVLFGGAAGGSKTKSALMFGIRCMKRWPGFRALFLRETYDELDENVYPELRAIDYAEAIGGHWNAGRRQLDIGGSAMRFRYMADLDDIRRRRGGSYQLILLDERNQLPAGTADGFRDRLRSANPDIPVIGLRSTANPGGRSHGELKDQYVDATDHGAKVVEVAVGSARFSRRFIPAKATDNPYLGPDYYEVVLGGIADPVLRRAMQDGDWDVFVGQYFGEWRQERHVVPRDALQLDRSWLRQEGIDYGRAAPFCMLRGARDGDGRLWLYREIYKAGLGERDQARLIKEDERRCGDRGVRRAGDPSMWNKTSDAASIAEAYAGEGVGMEKANNDRTSGWARVHSYLADAYVERDGELVGAPCPYHAALGWDACPMIHVLEGTCPNLTRTLPTLPFDKTKVEDLDTDAEDHAADALRYLLMQLPPLRTKRKRTTGAMQRSAAASTV